MNRILNLLILFFVASCANAKIEATSVPVIVNTKVLPTNTSLSPTPLPSSTPTQEISCDPFEADFCIMDGHFTLQRPIQLPANDLVDSTYTYGSTANGTREPHHGVDFANPSGTPVYAAGEGKVLFAGADVTAIYSPWPNFYGNLVVIEHADRLFTLYAHLSRIDVEAGQRVFAGEKIGEVGRTGVAIGSHLHFEVRRGQVEDYFATQNPELWLTPTKDVTGKLLGTLMISVMDQSHHLVNYAEFTLKYYPKKSEAPVKSYYGKTYSSDMMNSEENMVVGELPAGKYRIAVKANGKVYERWVEVKSGKLMQVVFVVK